MVVGVADEDGAAEDAATYPLSMFTQELVADPDGIAFGYGGVDPGKMHAHGQVRGAPLPPEYIQ